jgi:5-methyltetrahydropteroyltriglutamate--homocysteine methyltransferase
MSTPRLNPPFRAEHIGSFLRPPELLAARAEHDAGRLPAEGLRVAEDRAIRGIVAMQEDLGLDVVTDGEFRRGTYTENFTTKGITGVTAANVGEGEWAYTDAAGHKAAGRIPTVRGRIARHDSTNAENFAFVKSIAKATPKITLPGPCYIHFRAGRAHISRDAYPNLDDFWTDLVKAYAIELQKLAAAGCTYVQLDETSLAKLGDPKIREALDARGDDWRALLDRYVAVTNAVVAAAPAGLRIGMHLCRGNNAGHWQASGGYDAVAETMFRDIAIDFFFLEYDSPRAGTFEPLRAVPDGKTVVLGLVSTKTAALEPAELLIERIEEAARYMPREALALSPQCGFASGHKGNAITGAEQSAKLRRVVEVARRVWG